MNKGKLIPGQTLIYERANDVVFARYRDPPLNNIPRWVIGGNADEIAREQGNLFSYAEWKHMMKLSKNNKAFKIQLDRLLLMYYTIKDTEEEIK